ncbi:MAG: hypothetical protein PHI63_05370 [Patescibacteria group bacterium]|nr:hypothetical protein [Patescibacteria group bacterium]
MIIVLKADLPVMQVVKEDGQPPKMLPGGTFPAGRNKIERIANPIKKGGLVLRGTLIGHAESILVRRASLSNGAIVIEQ